MTSQKPISSQPYAAFGQRLVLRFGKSGAILLTILCFLLVGSLLYALQAETPWGKSVQKRVSKQQPLQTREYAIVGLWWGSVISSSLLLGLLGTAGKWMPVPVSGGASLKGKVSHRVFWAFTALAVLSAGYLRTPRLNHSLWNDEEYAMRRFSHGSWETQKDGALKFEPVSWNDTLFLNNNGNNHVLASLVTRLTLDVWRVGTHQVREAFSETALRTPALIASLLTIILIALLGLEAGGTWVGIGAAFLMAILPWHVRYAVESKGYSLMLFFICLNLWAILGALRENKLSSWLIFALSEAAYLLSFAGSIYVAIAINLMVAIELLRSRKWKVIRTLTAFNIIGAVPVILWMLPSIPQILIYLKAEDSLRLGMGFPWTRDYLSGLAICFQYDNPGTLHSGTSWLLQSMKSSWFFSLFFLWITPATIALGLVFSFLRNTASRLIILCPMLAGLMAYAHNAAHDNPMVVWYLLYTIIGFVVAIPLAITAIDRVKPWLSPALLAVFISVYGIMTWDANQTLMWHDRQPIRQTVAAIKQIDSHALTASFGVSDRQSQSYDPGVHVLETEKDLEECTKLSRESGAPLYVYYCGEKVSGQRRPELMKKVTQSEEFTFICTKPGHEDMFSYHVYQWKPSANPKR
ncbi:hypothetical protein BH11VER1_BH11VER1_28530 [soil metagenome]